jgi:hypothetical protein
MHAGLLPRPHQVTTWAGPGTGCNCAVCGDPVARDGLGFELEFRHTDGHVELHNVHMPCFAAWDLEGRQFLQAGTDGGTIADRERVEP